MRTILSAGLAALDDLPPGERRLRDCRTSSLDRIIKDRAALGYDPTMLRKVLHGMFAVAVRHDVMASNPVFDDLLPDDLPEIIDLPSAA